MRRNRTETKVANTTPCFEDHHASPTFILLSVIFCQKGNKLLSPFRESSQCRWSSRRIIRLFPDEKYSLFRRLRSRCGQLSDHKRLAQTVWFKNIKILLYYKFNRQRKVMTQESTRKTIDIFRVLMTEKGRAFTTCRQLFIKRMS